MSKSRPPIPPLREQPVVFLDVETTGLLPKEHEIIEIAAVAFDGSVLINKKIRPVRLETASPRALEINGYAAHPEWWKDAPTFDEIKEEVVEALEYKIIIGQNPKFDRGFVVEALERCGFEKAYKKIRRHTIDTVTLAFEHLVPCGLDRLNLDAECAFLGIDLDRAERHSALADAQAARTLYLSTVRATEEQRMVWRERAKRLGFV